MSSARKMFGSGRKLSGFHWEELEMRQLMTATLPVLPAILAPASNPALPAGFDLFTPQGAGSSAAGSPGIAQWTKSANPNDTIAISLTNPTTLASGSNSSDTQFFTYGQTTASNGALVSDTIEQLGAGNASVDLNSSNTANSMYLLWAKNAAGYSSAVAINKTDAWWVGPNQATAGQTVSVYGQNLTFTPTDGISWVYITQAGSSTGQWATVSSANPFQVSFTVPQGLAPGNYQVWVHNGHGGEYGWSSPVTLSVAAAAVAGPTFNVRNFGATGNGITNDTAAFQAAMNAASQYTNATVYAPAGNYLVSQITLATGATLIGDGAGQTVILENPSTPTASLPTMRSMVWLASNTQIENMTLDSNNVALPNVVFGRSLTNIHFTNVTFQGHLTQDMDIHADTLVFIENCNLIGNGSFLGTASQLFIDHSNFYGTNDANVLLYSWGGNDISITYCTAQDLNNSNPNSGAGWSAGRFFDGADLWGSQTNTYIGNNTTIALGVRPNRTDQNSGEQLLWEGQPLVSGGTYISSTATTVTYTGLPSTIGAGYYAIIVAGNGVGEYVPISSYNATTGVITLSQAWNANPDSTSVVRVGRLFANVAVYDNTLQGKGPANTASTGVQFYGGAINCVVDSNTISNVTCGITDVAMDYAGNVIPNYFNVLENNTITNSSFAIDVWGDSVSGQTGTAGDVLRFNTISGTTEEAILLRNYGAHGTPFYLVYQDNSVTNTPMGINLQNYGSAAVYLALNNDSFALGSASATGSAAIDANQSLVMSESGVTFTGFSQTYSGTVTPSVTQLVIAPSGTQGTSGLGGSGVLGATGGSGGSSTPANTTGGSSSTGSSPTTTETSGSGSSSGTGTGTGSSGTTGSSGSGTTSQTSTTRRYGKRQILMVTAQTKQFAAVTTTVPLKNLQTPSTIQGIDAKVLAA